MNRRQFFQLFSVGGLSGALGAIIGVKAVDFSNPNQLSPLQALMSEDGADLVGLSSGKSLQAWLDELKSADDEKGAALIAYKQRTVAQKLAESLSVKDFGCVGNGVVDDTANFLFAIQSAVAMGRSLFVPAGVYHVPFWAQFIQQAPCRIYGEMGARVRGAGNSSFFKVCDNLQFEGVGFEGFHTVVEVGALTAPIDIDLINCKDVNSKYFVNRRNDDVNNIAVNKFLATGCELNHSGVGSAEQTRAIRLIGRYNSAKVLFNDMSNINGTAIRIGSDDYAHQNDMHESLVVGNTIRGVAEPTSDISAHGVIVFGRSAKIHSNHIEAVTTADGSDCEGIYTKARYSLVHSNTLVDAGESEAAIALKGNRRDESHAPHGFSSMCFGNNIYFSSGGAKDGIFIQNEDIAVFGNAIEGAGRYGIYSQKGEYNNIKIRGNEIRRHLGSVGILSQSYGKNIVIKDNEVVDFVSNASVQHCYGIQVVSTHGQIEGLVVKDNKVDIGQECLAASSCRGINVFRNVNAINGAVIKDNEININHSALIEYGIHVTGTVAGSGWVVTGNDVSRCGNNKLRLDNVEPENLTVKNNVTGEDVITRTSLGVFDSGKTVTNEDATGTRNVSLPAAKVGLCFTVIKEADQVFSVSPVAGEIIRGGSVNQALFLVALGGNVTLRCVKDGAWEIVGGYGAYTYA